MTTTASPLPATAASLADGVTATHDASSAPTSASQAAVLTCTECGGDNARDSRFCRHCGAPLFASESASLSPASPLESSNGGSSAPPIIAHHNAADEALHPHSVAEGVDKGRAQHLVERAERLGERGDLSGAILACRQAIALTPQLVSGHAILGALLERTGDTKGAISAYEHVIELWPDSPLERERLRSLRNQSTQSSSSAFFHFDANELFPVTVAPESGQTVPERAETIPAGGTAPETAVPNKVEAVGGAVVAASSAGVSSSPDNGAISPSASNTPPGAASSATSPLSASGTPSLSPARVALPSAAALTAVPSISALPSYGNDALNSAPANGSMGGNATGSAPIFAPLVLEPERATKRRLDSSYFWRGAPLAATVGTGLLFLLWAANWSAARRNDVIVPAAADTIAQVVDDPTATSDNGTTGPARLAQGVPGGGPNVVQPGDPRVAANFGSPPAPPAPSSASNQNNAGTNTAPRSGGSGPINNSGAPVASQRTSPRFPSVRSGGLVPPLPVSPGSVVNSSPRGSGSQNDVPRMSPPQIPSAGSPPITLGNSNNAGDTAASTGGAPINPVYGGGRGYIRLHTGPASGSSAPTRPNTQAGSSERDASNAARSGQGSRAVNDASAAINRTGAGDPNLAFRFQTRALLFLEQGDNARAIDDFNRAIQAYQDQIARDPGDTDAREGLEACRRGLRLAQRRLGR